jgi:hypothetical protein
MTVAGFKDSIMSLMFEVYYGVPADDAHEQKIEAVVKSFGGEITYREHDSSNCLTCEFQIMKDAEGASHRLRELGEHVEGIGEYGDD